MDTASDEVTAETPSSPLYREGASMWLWDDAGRFAFPRIGVEAVGATWTTSFGVALCMAVPGGRLRVLTTDAPPHHPTDGFGRPRVLGAGPLRFECFEPFVHWQLVFDGDVTEMSVQEYLDGGTARASTSMRLRLEVDARMVTAPWVQGTFDPEGQHVTGEHRFEQLCTVTGTVEVDGSATSFGGGGLRIHRKGGNRSDYGDFYGHNWQSARFPSGRAFGFIHYRPRPDGSAKYREGWVLDGDGIQPARVEGTSWMSQVQPAGEDVSFTLRTAKNEVVISGETFVSAFRAPRPIGDGTTFPLLQSGIAKYRWDGEEAYGMIERSALL